mmetsp:Transcript_23462/g.54716  ORF Transcript_23462/g.54716 Transcript_23462/m.54716 type:complete len:116 (+) Transcript_23462:53-400(+)
MMTNSKDLAELPAAHVKRRPRDDVAKKKDVLKLKKRPEKVAEELQNEAKALAAGGSVRAAVDAYRGSIEIVEPVLEVDPLNEEAIYVKEMAEYQIAKLKPFMGMEYILGKPSAGP